MGEWVRVSRGRRWFGWVRSGEGRRSGEGQGWAATRYWDGIDADESDDEGVQLNAHAGYVRVRASTTTTGRRGGIGVEIGLGMDRGLGGCPCWMAVRSACASSSDRTPRRSRHGFATSDRRSQAASSCPRSHENKKRAASKLIIIWGRSIGSLFDLRLRDRFGLLVLPVVPCVQPPPTAPRLRPLIIPQTLPPAPQEPSPQKSPSAAPPSSAPAPIPPTTPAAVITHTRPLLLLTFTTPPRHGRAN